MSSTKREALTAPAPRPEARHAAATTRRRPRLRAWLSWLHLWLGLSVGTAFAAIGLSGSVLVFHGELLRLQHPQLAATPAHADGAVLERILAQWTPQGLVAIDLPREALPAWQAYFADDSRRYFAPADGALLLTRTPQDDALLWLHELHVHLLGGEFGAELVGVVGWIALFLLLSGLYLWWPRVGRWITHLRVHRGPPLRRWLSWHRSFGALTLPLLLLVTLTGVGMVYHDAARTLLTAAFGGGDAPRAPAAQAQPIDWPRVLAAAHGAWPDAEVVRIAPGAADAGVQTLRLRRAAEWHPNGRSLVFAGNDGRLLGRHDATAQAAGARMNEAIYPLHIGAVGGWPYRIAVALSGLLPAFLLVTGFLFWRRRRRG